MDTGWKGMVADLNHDMNYDLYVSGRLVEGELHSMSYLRSTEIPETMRA